MYGQIEQTSWMNDTFSYIEIHINQLTTEKEQLKMHEINVKQLNWKPFQKIVFM